MTRRIVPTWLLVIAIFLIVEFAGCSSHEASLDTLTKPVVTSPTPTPTVDPRITDIERIRVGMEAPDFSLTDQNGKTVGLSSYRGRKYVVLVFYRGGFCGICIDQLGKLKSLLSDKEKQNVQIVGLSIDSREDTQGTIIVMSKYDGKSDFPLVEDRNHAVIDRYGLFNPEEYKPGIPYPAVYILNKEGVITHRFIDPKTYHRATNDEIRAALKEAGAL